MNPAAPRLSFFFEFASSYSYLAAMRIGAAAEAAGVAVHWRPFLLGPIFRDQGWTTSPFNLYPAKGRYMWRDIERLCAAAGLPFRRPAVFPQMSVTAARLALVGLGEATQPRWGEAFCRAAFGAAFGTGADIGERAVLVDVLQHCGVDAEAALAAAQSEPVKRRLREETAAAQELGVFGAPSFVTADGELFWGNDRLEQALTWAARIGG